MLTTRDVAKILDIGERYVRYLIARHALPTTWHGNVHAIDEDELDYWIRHRWSEIRRKKRKPKESSE